jgi:hypothetical protein
MRHGRSTPALIRPEYHRHGLTMPISTKRVAHASHTRLRFDPFEAVAAGELLHTDEGASRFGQWV